MFANLLASARELRFPLTVGYAALFTVWLVLGESLAAAARSDPLGQRMLAALHSLGSAAEIGIITFAAAMVGSVLWHLGVARLVRFIASKAGHPDWPKLVDQAREAAREYGEYRVVTVKGRDSPFDQQHHVPSATWATYLAERVQERERKASEMSFRVTLAVALVPVVVALGFEGGGLWWLSFLGLPLVWLDVTLLKYTTLRVVNRFRLEDLNVQLRSREKRLQDQEAKEGKSESEEKSVRLQGLRDEVSAIRAEIAEITAKNNRPVSKFFALLQGSHAE